MPAFPSDYPIFTEQLGQVALENRTLLEVAGRDAAAFLHNFSTHQIKELPVGCGCELFFPDVKGKAVGYGLLFRRQDSFLLETAPDQAETLIAHLDRYLITEDVQFHDRSASWRQRLICGEPSQVQACLHRVFSGGVIPEKNLQHEIAGGGESALWLSRLEIVQPAVYLLSGPGEAIAQAAAALSQAGAAACSQEAWEAVRVESAWPQYGCDIGQDRLPQEIDRDAQAISFTKGCYLGQETIARLDAMGHVNWILRKVKFFGDQLPLAGGELTHEGKTVGRTLSAVWSPRYQAPLALAYVRASLKEGGQTLLSEWGEAEVLSEYKP